MEFKSHENKEVVLAYLSIRDFFSWFGLDGAIKEREQLVHAATIEKIWDKAPPCSLINFINHLHDLNRAVFTLNNKFQVADEAVLSGTTEEGMPADSHMMADLWNCFPRSLSYRQYCNPYKALRKFCAYMTQDQWNKAIDELLEYALDKSSINELILDYDMLSMRRHLLRMIEACYLVHTRINTKKMDSSLKEKATRDGKDAE